ncbi:Fic family protein [Bradyrhizobium brasilense]|uniref:Fic family protein n=1 Tax=Bradyrhizobium brasilense TaxID=1419277 RepID=UPI001AEC774E
MPVSPGALPRFLTRFEEAYAKLGKTDAIVASACTHHRLLWIHPFLDGNGRVARLMSYAMQRETLDAGGLLVHRARPCPQRGDLQATSYCL